MANILMRLFKQIDNVILLSYALAILILTLSFVMGYNTDVAFSEDDTKYSFTAIFINNTSLTLVLFLGVLSFGVINVFLATLNGFGFGTTLAYGFKEWGMWDSLLKIVPHGMFEIPSLLISTSVGLIPLLLIIKKGKSKEEINVKHYLKYVGLVLLLAIILNVLGALVEAKISMNL